VSVEELIEEVEVEFEYIETVLEESKKPLKVTQNSKSFVLHFANV
jgi:hypothetical protein